MFALTREYKDKIPGDPWKHNVTYVDLSFTLRSTGVECFLEHMKYQRNIIVDILKKSGEEDIIFNEEVTDSFLSNVRRMVNVG